MQRLTGSYLIEAGRVRAPHGIAVRTPKYYDGADTSAELEDALWDDSTGQERMVTTSLRLPRSTMDDVRREAE